MCGACGGSKGLSLTGPCWTGALHDEHMIRCVSSVLIGVCIVWVLRIACGINCVVLILCTFVCSCDDCSAWIL